MRSILITLFTLLFFIGHSQQMRVLSLEECIAIAIENNLSVQRSELNYQTSEVILSQAIAQRYPTLSANGSWGYSWGRSIDPNSNLFVNQRINSNSVGAFSTTPLMRGFQVSNSIRQSKVDLQASKFDLERAKNDISLNVASFYLNVILNKELVENAQFQLKSSQQQLEQTKMLVESGALPRANELQMESQVATNEVNLINTQNNLDLSLLTLKQALLLPPGEEMDIVVPKIDLTNTDVEVINSVEVYEYALLNQPEIKAADSRITSSRLGYEVAKGGLYPTLNLNANINTNYSDAVEQIFVPDGGEPMEFVDETNLETIDGTPIVQNVEIPSGDIVDYGVTDQWEDNLRYSVSLGLSIPILNGFVNKGNAQRAKINLQQSEINAKEERNALYQTVETAYRNAIAASRTFAASEKQVASLQETFRAVENQYTHGAANFTDYQVASNNLFQAQSDLARSKYDYIFRKKIVDFYLGKSLTFE